MNTPRRAVRPAGFEPATFGFEDCGATGATINDSNELRQTPDAVVPTAVPSASEPASNPQFPESDNSQCIEWYHEGQSRTVETNGVRIEIRFIGGKGRRARIAIVAPPGATFRAAERAS